MMSSFLVKPKVTMMMLADANLTLNKSKFEFNKRSISFLGFVFSEKGIAPDPAKVESIDKALTPTTTTAVKSFLGMVTYCAKFIPNFSDVSEPLRKLTRKDQPFLWVKNRKDLLTQ